MLSGTGGYGADRKDAESDADEDSVAFPRISDRVSAKTPADGEILIRINQRRANDRQQQFEVQESSDGHQEIPMSVSATTVSSWLTREVLTRSPWLARCLAAPEGTAIAKELATDDQDDFQEIMAGDSTQYAVTVKRVSEAILDVGLPSCGAGQRLLVPKGLLQCLDLAAPGAEALDLATFSATSIFTLFLWASVLELHSVLDVFRKGITDDIKPSTVALAFSVAHATNDSVLLHRCYWCIRQLIFSGSGASLLDSKNAVKLVKGALCHTTVCRTPLRALASVVEADWESKRHWATATDCYTLTQIHRLRDPNGSYPQRYEMRLDHSDETLLTAVREDEQSPCRIYAGKSGTSTSSEHDEDFLGTVCPNFWGTMFTLFDSGSDVDTLVRNTPAAKDLPLRPRAEVCKIGYDTNILGDCPRKITLDFERNKERHHMENISPRWDSKLNSYALPFFGRVKKASAKNFQLVVNGDPNTIYLMFGKISKDVFCLDFRAPIAPLDAMAIASASLAKKRAVS